MRSPSRGDHDVGAVAGVVQVFKVNGLTFEFISEADCPVVGTVGHENRGAAMGHKMPRCELTHFAGAHQEHLLPGQISENLFRQVHRD